MRIRADRLRELVAICENILNETQRTPVASARVLYARSFFQKGTFHGRSICVLIGRMKEHNESDLAGVCALARSLIETHNVFLYLTESGIGQQEREFRVALMHLNQATDLRLICDTLGSGTEDFLFWNETSRRSAISELKSNPVFLSLDENQRKNLLQGKKAYLKSRYKGDHPVNPKIEAAVYNLFSHNVHSFGLSSSHGGGATPAGFFHTLFLGVELSSIYLANLVKHYATTRPRSVSRLVAGHRELLEDVLSLNHFVAWQTYLRSGGQ